MGEPGPFKIVLHELEGAGAATLGNPNADRVRSELARLFNLDDGMASSIIGAMPIVILDGLGAHQAGVVRERLQRLARMGVKVVTTDEECDQIPRVNWPDTPSIAQVSDPAPAAQAPAPAANTPPPGTLCCPSCHSTFRLVPLEGGSPSARSPEPAARATPVREPDPDPFFAEPLAVEPGGGEQRSAASSAPDTRAAGETRLSSAPPLPDAPEEEEEDDWMSPPVSWVGPPEELREVRAEPKRTGGTARFDEAALLAYRRAEVEPSPPPPPPEPLFVDPPAPPPVARDEGRRDDRLQVSFTESSDGLSLGRAPQPGRKEPSRSEAGRSEAGRGDAGRSERGRDGRNDRGRDPFEDPFEAASVDPFEAASVDPFEAASVDPFDAVSVDPFEATQPREAARSSDPFGDPFGEAPSDERRGGFVPQPASAPAKDESFEATGSLHDSGSDILDLDPPHRVRESQVQSIRESGSFQDDFNLLEDSNPRVAPKPPKKGSDRRPSLGDLEDLEEVEDPRAGRGARAPEPAYGGLATEDDDLARMLEEDARPAPAARGGGRSSGGGRSAKRGRGGDELDDLLQMFGPEDEEPLDDLAGLEPAPLDLNPRAGKDPFSSGFPSDILEPLNPSEAMEIIKSQKSRSGQGRTSAASQSSPFEALGSDDGLDLFADSGANHKRPPGRSKKKTRGVPFSVSDEDLDLFEDSSRPRGRSGSGARPPAANQAPVRSTTDPFARARREMEEERGGGGGGGGGRPSSDRAAAGGGRRTGGARSAKTSARTKSAKAPTGGGGGGGGPAPKGAGDHGLVLSRISDPEKKDKAAELIAEIKGCSVDDAQRLTERTIIPVLKGVSREVAEFHLDKFRRFKIAGRVTTRQRSS
ncbi:MAG: hypothetical protein AB7N76_13205 [Planctomycetota bacterium]